MTITKTKKQNPYIGKLPLTKPIQTPYTKRIKGDKWFISDIKDYQTSVVTMTTVTVVLQKDGSPETKTVTRQIQKTTPQGRPNNVDARRVKLAKRQMIDHNYEFSPRALMDDIKKNWKDSPHFTIYKSHEDDDSSEEEDSSEEIELSEPVITEKPLSQALPPDDEKFLSMINDRKNGLEQHLIETFSKEKIPVGGNFFKLQQEEFDALMRLRSGKHLSNSLSTAINLWFFGSKISHPYYYLYQNCSEPTD